MATPVVKVIQKGDIYGHKSDDFKEMVFNLMDDSASPEEYPDFEDAYLIKNEFADGEICEKMFSKIYNIYTELYDRLISLDPSNAADYDSKFDCILDYMLYIDHYLCIKMYDYGVMFAEKYNRK